MICCEVMDDQLNYEKHCKEHGNDCPDVVLRHCEHNKYYLISKNATYSCNYCPWCGDKLVTDDSYKKQAEAAQSKKPTWKQRVIKWLGDE